MKRVVFIFILVLGLAWNCHAQTWTYLQDSISTVCSPGASSCTVGPGNMLPTTPGSVWVVSIHTSADVTITTSGGWTLCPASACHIYSSTHSDNIDFAYQLAGAGGTTSITVTLSGSSGSFLGVNFYEFLPPAGSIPFYDTAGTVTSTTCSKTCSGVGLTLGGTDVIIQDMHFNSVEVWNGWSAPYITLPVGEGLYLNATSGAAPTATVSGTGGEVAAIAFKSSLGSFPPPPQSISVVSYTNPQGLSCGSCQLTGVPNFGAGHLLYIEAGDLNGSYISSVSGGGTWVVPTGANTCRASLSGGFALSCAYVLSSTATTSPPTVTMTGSGVSTYFAVWELSSATGAFSFDTQASTSNSASYTPSGMALSLTGSDDVIFESAIVPGGTSAVSLYPMPRNPGNGTMFLTNNEANAVLLNTTNGAAPRWANEQHNATVVTGVAFMATGGTTAPNPPTGLKALAY